MSKSKFNGKYEGWRNQATWAVALRINNDRVLFEKMLATKDLRWFLSDFCLFGYRNADQNELFEHFDQKIKEIFACRPKQLLKQAQ